MTFHKRPPWHEAGSTYPWRFIGDHVQNDRRSCGIEWHFPWDHVTLIRRFRAIFAGDCMTFPTRSCDISHEITWHFLEIAWHFPGDRVTFPRRWRDISSKIAWHLEEITCQAARDYASCNGKAPENLLLQKIMWHEGHTTYANYVYTIKSCGHWVTCTMAGYPVVGELHVPLDRRVTALAVARKCPDLGH